MYGVGRECLKVLRTLRRTFSENGARLQPTDSGKRAFGGLNHLEGFLPLPSEDYNISTACTSSMTDIPLLRKFPFCIRVFFYVRCSRTHPHFWERTASVCIIHLCSVFAPPQPFFYCISFLRISLFSSHVHPCVLSICRATYLADYLFGGYIYLEGS